MAGPDTSGSESQRLESLAKQLADLERQSADYIATQQRSASVRKLLTLVVVALLVIYGTMYYTTGKALYDPKTREQFVQELERSRAANSDELMRHVYRLREDTWPT